MSQHGGRCAHPGCPLLGLPCYLDLDGPEVEDFLCPEHAAQAGYCSVCGLWAADQAGFDVAPLCTDCLGEFARYRPGSADDPGF